MKAIFFALAVLLSGCAAQATFDPSLYITNSNSKVLTELTDSRKYVARTFVWNINPTSFAIKTDVGNWLAQRYPGSVVYLYTDYNNGTEMIEVIQDIHAVEKPQ